MSRISARAKLSLLFRTLRCAGSPYQYSSILFTRRCNLRCDYCQVPFAESRDIPLGQWKAIVDEMARFRVPLLAIAGGEPLMRDDLYDLIAHVHQRKIISVLVSNFARIGPKVTRELTRAGLDALVGSVHDGHALGRDGSNSAKVVQELAFARTLGIMPIIEFVVTPRNLDQVIPSCHDILDRGIFFYPELVQRVGGSFSTRDHDGEPLDEARTLAVFRQLVQLKRRRFLVLSPYPFLENAHLYFNGRWRCPADKEKWLYIKNDGTIMVCQEFPTNVSFFRYRAALVTGEWQTLKREIVRRCPGCYYNCYYSNSAIGLLGSVREARSFVRI
jgi:MoaA/NifB/PqqE/SkfB family radical SAM enzyme